ncbi:P-selectin isoform X2 [Sander lucioperca]|uniref:P-selectin isoform X2 n=1 Tax=Sander lucioperca TaxID=283035 RepID=UPI001653A842|nr:P-selectin isoform X2 [Sander lucioperca]
MRASRKSGAGRYKSSTLSTCNSQNPLLLRCAETKEILRVFSRLSHIQLKMKFCFGLLQNCGSKSSWISLTFLCSMLCMWTSVESWSYYYSNTTMNWPQARAWCQKHYTDMVAIQNQEEIGHLNSWLPKKPTYYWIGIRKVNNIWTWVGTNKALTAEATNWAPGEPNNGKKRQSVGANEDCVEMYIKSDKHPGKWNDERCGKLKTALCYTAACKNDSCRYGDCVETINSHKCACFEGFYGEGCEHVVKCNEEQVTVPYKGSVNCTHKHGNFSYDSLCQYSCEEGYQLSMSRPLTCTASTQWSERPPTCELVQCQELSSPARGSMKCSNPLGPSSYQSTCVFTCDEGYVLADSPSNTLQCKASGFWNASQPLCVAVQCPALPKLDNGTVSCGDDADVRFSYGNTCSVSCAPGYHLVGPSRVTCTSAAEWSESMPRCEAITCQKPEGEAHLITQCSRPSTELRPDSTCSFSCKAGFELQGAHTTQCSEDGQWSKAIPTCKVVQCNSLKAPPNAFMQCQDPRGVYSYGSICSVLCEEGFDLIGTNMTKCSSEGNWSHALPVCQAKWCEPINPPHGSLSCSDPNGSFSFGSLCTTTCDEGFLLNGTDSTECTSLGMWSADIPHCLAKRCPTVNSFSHGSLVCSDPHGEFSFGSQCKSTCEEGFLLNGTADTECTSLGMWSADIPGCLAKRCSTLSSPSHGSLVCSDPHGEFSFGSRCTSTCEEGFLLNGTADTECTSLGMWSTDTPRCLAQPCPLLAKAPQNGRMNCSHPYSSFSFGSHCDFECDEGFWLRGTQTMTCNNSGHWSQDLPTCQPVQCESIRALSLSLSMNCSHPLGNFSFGSQCLFTCEEGFYLNGTNVLLCSSTGFWSTSLPTCTGMPVGWTAMLLSPGLRAVYVVVLLVLIGLAVVIIMRFKKKGNTIMEQHAPAWGDRENPAFDFKT